MRQTKTENEKEKKRCSSCGAGLWLKDQITGEFSGPWHFIDCPTIPGGAELNSLRLEERIQRDKEKWIPRQKGLNVMAAITCMLESPSREIMLQRKQAIHEEINRL